MLVQTAGLFSPLTGTKKKVDPGERTNPIKIHFTQTLEKHIEISHPPSWDLTTELDDVSFSNRFGRINGTYKKRDSTLVVDQSVTLTRSQDGPDGMPDLLRLTGSTSALQIPTLIFRPRK